MRKVSGIRFSDGKFLRDFEREARRKFPPEEAAEILNSYTIHRSDGGVLLEFRDMAAIGEFLERARAVNIAGRTFRLVKLLSVTPTGFFLMPASSADRWARQRIESVAREGRQRDSMVLTAEGYERLREEFRGASVELERYIR